MTPGAWKNELAADFRRQLTLPQQRQLFDYWLGHCADDAWPRREAIRPADIRTLLANTLLLELAPLPEGVRVHLAGSDLWDVYGGELTGATLHDGRWGPGHAHWRYIYEQLHTATQPMNGHGLGLCAREHLALFWLRLPLSTADGRIFLLGLDIALPASRAPFDTGEGTMAASSLPDGDGMPRSISATPTRIRIGSRRNAAPPST